MTAARLIELLASHIHEQGRDFPVEVWPGPLDSRLREIEKCWFEAERNIIVLGGAAR